MKQKLLAGFSSLVVAGSFFACGDGEIYEMTTNDEIIASLYEGGSDTSFKEVIKEAKANCENDPVCVEEYRGYLDGTATIPSSADESGNGGAESSASNGGNTPFPGTSSRSIVGGSSSSPVFADNSSSSAEIVAPKEGLGSCGADKNPIEKGGATTWSFKSNDPSISGYDPGEFAVASYTWTFKDADAVSQGGGIASISDLMQYSLSGKKNASVTVRMKDGTVAGSVDCTPLQVNGDPISCTCTATGGDVDPSKDGGVATWTATCTSKSEIINYAWNGTDGTSTTFTHTFAEKGEKFTPTLSVGNNDSTVIDVKTCPEVVATDSRVPDYELKFSGDLNATIDSIPTGACITVSGTWSNSGYSPSAKVTCDLQCNGECSASLTFGKVSDSGEGTYNISVSVGIGTISEGDFKPEDQICIEFTNYDVDWQKNKTDKTAETIAKCKLGT